MPTTFYFDTTGGTDASNGLSWANAKRTWAACTAGLVAPGDTIKFNKSPDPTLLGNCLWSDGPAAAGYTATNITSSTAAVPIKIISTAHGLVTGDVCYITGHTTNTPANGNFVVTQLDSSALTLNDSSGLSAGGASGTIVKWNHKCVLQDTASTLSISNCDKIWTTYDAAKCAVLLTVPSGWEGYGAATFQVQAAAGVEALTYVATDNTDFSNYSQISFSIITNVAWNANDFQLRLCSDLTGTVPVNTFNLPAVYTSSIYGVTPVTIDYGSALDSNIQSISFYQAVDKGALQITIDNIIACKSPASADSLSLMSFISKDSTAFGGTEGWYYIRSITGRIINLCLAPVRAITDTLMRGYTGDTTNCPTYKREGFIIPGTSAGSNHFTIPESGTLNNHTTYSGGWNPATDQQDGDTFYDGQNSFGQAFKNAQNYVNIERFSCRRYSYGYSCSGNYCTYNINSVDAGSSGGGIGGNSCVITIWTCVQGELMSGAGYNSVLNCKRISMARQYGLYDANQENNIYNIDRIWGNVLGIYLTTNGGPNTYQNIWFRRNGTVISPSTSTSLSFINCRYDENPAAPFTIGNAGWGTYMFSQDHNRVSGEHRIYSDGGTSFFDSTSGNGGPGWTCTPGTTRGPEYPFSQKMLRVACDASKILHVRAQVYKSHATNVRTDLYIRGNQITGVPTDLSWQKTDTTAWETLDASCTPTVNGYVDVNWRSWFITGAGTDTVRCDATLTCTLT
jgi:hypothetical protein